jgi:hypothetical protein
MNLQPQPNASGTAQITLALQDDGGTADGGADLSGPQTFAINISKHHPWHNTLHRLDVTGKNDQPDGQIVAGDALAIINYINAFGAGKIPDNAAPGAPYLDTTGGPGNHGDNNVVAGDALDVINYVNAFGSGSSGPAGEGEASGAALGADYDVLALLAIDVASQAKRRRSG